MYLESNDFYIFTTILLYIIYIKKNFEKLEKNLKFYVFVYKPPKYSKTREIEFVS